MRMTVNEGRFLLPTMLWEFLWSIFGAEPEHSPPWYFQSSIIPYNFYFPPPPHPPISLFTLIGCTISRICSENIHAVQIINWRTHSLHKTNKETDGQRENKTKTKTTHFLHVSFVTTYIQIYKRLIRDIQAEGFLVTLNGRQRLLQSNSPLHQGGTHEVLTRFKYFPKIFATIRKHLQDMIFVLERNSEEPHTLCIYSMTSVTVFSKTWTNIMSSPNVLFNSPKADRIQ